MWRDEFSFSWEYLLYESVDKRRSEQYVNGEILDHLKPGLYSQVVNANERRHEALHVSNLAVFR